jgi:hypothetical protein
MAKKPAAKPKAEKPKDDPDAIAGVVDDNGKAIRQESSIHGAE